MSGGEDYRPTVIHFEEAGCIELVSRDCATIYDDITPEFAVIRDMTTREPIGFRLCCSPDTAQRALRMEPQRG